MSAINNTARAATHKPKRQQAGIALLGALVVVATVAMGASTLLDQQAVLSQTLQTERDRAQARWLLRGGLDWARMTLELDARHNSVTRADGIWAQAMVGLRIDIPNSTRVALLSGQIQDEQGKFNVLNLLPAAPAAHMPRTTPAVARQQLQQLLGILGLPVALASAIEQRLQQAQTEQFFWKSILDLVPDDALTSEQQRLISDHLTLLPPNTPLNINTASAAVLSVRIQGLDLGRAQTLVQQRNKGQWFNSVGDFLNRINIPANPSHQQLDIGSHWFMVQGQVTLDHAARHMQALLYRPDAGVAVVRWIKE